MIHVRGERGENPRCWLWLCLSEDAVRMHIDPTRSARAARVLFAEFGEKLPVICGVRPLRRLSQAGARAAGAICALNVLGKCCGQEYVAESRLSPAEHENPPRLRNIIF